MINVNKTRLAFANVLAAAGNPTLCKKDEKRAELMMGAMVKALENNHPKVVAGALVAFQKLVAQYV